ncbi:unnamed protein product [Acanthoscelides obtectus]|uniref:Uncharacterized protein n=1 Tax=Acanthoscelides obtectus TaxID=200917 RepID=A0A9P0LMI3_ACAOB|nr:unnamed protein product [Acanthoscelides obtectus]CAK1652577.1 hypothetical protein AOBTE_LOCUS17854 [Acanthoscelides obtectus]
MLTQSIQIIVLARRYRDFSDFPPLRIFATPTLQKVKGADTVLLIIDLSGQVYTFTKDAS